MVNAEDVLSFWLDDVGPKGWYEGGDALDAKCRDKFGAAWQDVLNGAYGLWLTYPSGSLAYIILTDQLSRNIWRDHKAAFATDHLARAAAKTAIERKWDLAIDGPARQFFYMPLMHSENLCDQDRAVRLFHKRMPNEGADHMLHARAHRDVIRQFGRFPYRNAALERASTNLETAYLDAGGYGHTVRNLKAPA